MTTICTTDEMEILEPIGDVEDPARSRLALRVKDLNGKIVGLIQALTQIQEQTVAFVPKLIAMLLALGLSLPWVLSRLIEYSHDLIANIPTSL